MSAGLTITELIQVVRDQVPTDRLGDLLRRLPPKFFDPELQLFRPATAAVLIAMAMVDDPECDHAVADLVEVVAADPSPELPVWTITPDGQKLQLSAILQTVAGRLAALYAPKPARRSPVPTA